MSAAKKIFAIVAGLIVVLSFQNCSGMGANQNTANAGQGVDADPVPPVDDPPVSDPVPDAVRIAATNQTANSHPLCKQLGDFYWEIGDRNGKLGAGAVGTTYGADTVVGIASASKILFGAFVIEQSKGLLTDRQKSALRMLSGFNGLNPIACAQAQTASACLNAGNGNFKFSPEEVGMFHYDGAHDQKLVVDAIDQTGMGYGDFSAQQFNTLIFGTLGVTSGFGYAFPLMAGGIEASPAQFAVFLRAIVSGKLLYKNYLGADAVCTLPGVCPTAASSPAPVNWHYSYNHWVEDDPTGDGSYSSPGAFGFYPWISKDKTQYGIISRKSAASGGFASTQCGQQLRKAWSTGQAQ